MHDGSIVTWRNGDHIVSIVASVVEADAVEGDFVALDRPLFLPLILDATEDVAITTVAPLRVFLADVGVENDQGAADEGALAPADEEIEGVAYEVIDGDDDDVDDDWPRPQRHHDTILDDSNHQLLNHMSILMR